MCVFVEDEVVTRQGCPEEDCGSCVNCKDTLKKSEVLAESAVSAVLNKSMFSLHRLQDLKSRHKDSFFHNLLFLCMRPKERLIGPCVIGSRMIVDQ